MTRLGTHPFTADHPARLMATDAEMDAAIVVLADAIDTGFIVIEHEPDERNTDVH